jgi:hypothetical protein
MHDVSLTRTTTLVDADCLLSPATRSTVFSKPSSPKAKSRVDSVVVTEDGEFAASFRAIAALALANKLPSIGAREYAVTMTVFLIDARHTTRMTELAHGAARKGLPGKRRDHRAGLRATGDDARGRGLR